MYVATEAELEDQSLKRKRTLTEPWFWQRKGCMIKREFDNRTLATVSVARKIEAEVNAQGHLMAAAPELYQALLRAQEELRLINMKDTGAIYDVSLRVSLNYALAKAEGRTS